MVRKIAYIGLSYLIGLFFASFFNGMLNLCVSGVVILACLLWFVLFGKKHIGISSCILGAGVGMFIYGLYDYNVYQQVVKYDGYYVEIKGEIADITEYSGDKSAYIIKGIINDDVKGTVTCYTDSCGAEIGDSVSIIGLAEAPEDSYSFPAKSYYKAKGIYLRVSRIHDFNYYESNSFSLKKTVYRYREHILGVMGKYMNDESCGVMAAMLFGDKTGIESSEKTLMYRAGIGHIMAVSGVHLSVVCSFFWFVLSKIDMNKYLRFGILLIPITCFVLLAGMSNSVMRAAFMIIFVYGSELLKRHTDTFTSLGFSVILLTLTSPFAIRDASLLLSAAGVFGIGVAAPAVIKFIEEKRPLGKISQSLVSSFCVMVVVFPVTVLFFDEVSVISPISNLILLPVCELILIGGILVTVTGGTAVAAVPILKICDILCRFVIALSEFIGSLHFSYIPFGSRYVQVSVIAALAMIGVLFLICRKKKYAAVISGVVLTALMVGVNVQRNLSDGNMNIAVIKKGEAVSAVVHDKKTACIIDLSGGGETAANAVKYLNRNGIYRIEAVVLNADANASLPVYEEYLRLFEVNSILIPESEIGHVGSLYSDIMLTVYSEDGYASETMECTADFSGENAVLSCRGSEFIMNENEGIEYDGEFYTDESVKFIINSDGMVKYETVS